MGSFLSKSPTTASTPDLVLRSFYSVAQEDPSRAPLKTVEEANEDMGKMLDEMSQLFGERVIENYKALGMKGFVRRLVNWIKDKGATAESILIGLFLLWLMLVMVATSEAAIAVACRLFLTETGPLVMTLGGWAIVVAALVGTCTLYLVRKHDVVRKMKDIMSTFFASSKYHIM